jgi:hypothetical protein
VQELPGQASVRHLLSVKAVQVPVVPFGTLIVSPGFANEIHAATSVCEMLAAVQVGLPPEQAANAGAQKIAHPTKVAITRRFRDGRFIEYSRTIPQKRES